MIRNIRVKNFKSLKDVSLPLGLRNVLVGPNMSGKSNLIDVFRFLSGMVFPKPGVHGLPNAFNALDGVPAVLWKGGDSDLISISLDGDALLDRDAEKQIRWSYEISILADPARQSATVQKELLAVFGPDGEYKLIDHADGQRLLKDSHERVISRVQHSERSGLNLRSLTGRATGSVCLSARGGSIASFRN